VAAHRVDALAPGVRFTGPAVLDDVDTTIWVPPGAEASLDEFRNVVIEMERA
jgi:N-methylhydantoinase A